MGVVYIAVDRDGNGARNGEGIIEAVGERGREGKGGGPGEGEVFALEFVAFPVEDIDGEASAQVADDLAADAEIPVDGICGAEVIGAFVEGEACRGQSRIRPFLDVSRVAGTENNLGGAGAELENGGNGVADLGLLVGFTGGEGEFEDEIQAAQGSVFSCPRGEDTGDRGISDPFDGGIWDAVFFAGSIGVGEACG